MFLPPTNAFPGMLPWKPLVDGERVPVASCPNAVLSVFDCGTLILPTGKLAACDPAVGFAPDDQHVTVPPGEYPVRLTLANVTPDLPLSSPESMFFIAYASVVLDPSPEVLPTSIPRKPLMTFGVDAGVACFYDHGSVMASSGIASEDEDDDGEDEGEEELPQVTFLGLDHEERGRSIYTKIPIPKCTDGANTIIFRSGWGDGRYPLVGGYDANGRLVAIHIDFGVVGELSETCKELLKQIDAARKSGDLVAHGKLLRKAQSLYPEDRDVLLESCDFALHRGNVKEALVWAAHAATTNRQSAIAWSRYATLLAQHGNDPAKTIKAFDHALAIHPPSMKTSVEYAHYLLKIGKIKRAEERYRASVVLRETSESLEALAAFLARVRRKPAQALPLAEKAVRIDREDAKAYATLSMILKMLGRTGEAETALEKARSLGWQGSEPTNETAIQGIARRLRSWLGLKD